MQFPESWLRQYCNPPLSTQQLADTLTMAGLEVEDIRPVAPAFTNVVVAEIVETKQHPNADRLKICQVNVGSLQFLTIVCGAPNARPGIRIPCALIGAELPSNEDGKPFLIKLGKLRGVESQGMLCSAKELGLSDDQAGLLELDSDAPVGQCIRAHLSLDDTLLTLKLTPNLAHCLSVFGVARELSALTGAPLRHPTVQAVPVTVLEKLAVSVQASDLCGRFSGRMVKNINSLARTPRWMVERLTRCGQRSISPLVDISNYVMFEMGQPTHIFDADKLHGDMVVRWGRRGETLKLLNGNVAEIDEMVGVIADEHGVESLAGIMGGDATAVSDDTRNVYVEAAFWWPKSVAGRSRRYNFSTDAGHRFERGVDPQQTTQCIEYITRLILDICGGEAGPVDDQQPNMPQNQPVILRVARAERVIGMPLTLERCSNALRGLGLSVEEVGDTLRVTPPSYRFDLQIEEDLIEEVARVVGYDKLPQTPPKAPVFSKILPESRRNAYSIRRMLATMGYQETINFSFVDQSWERDLGGNSDPIRLLNPIASHMSVMRSSLLASLVNVARFNLDRKVERVCVFEIGRVFIRDSTVQNTDTTVAGFQQPLRVAGLVFGSSRPLSWEGKSVGFDYFDVKGHVETLLAPAPLDFESCVHPALHPGRSAKVISKGKVIGHLGELHPKWRQAWGFSGAPVVFELDLDAVLERKIPDFKAFSKHQAVERDIALWVSESTTHAELMSGIYSAVTNGWLQKARLFDIYRPESIGDQLAEKSVAIRLTLQREDAGMTDQDIESVVTSVIEHLAKRLGARLRT